MLRERARRSTATSAASWKNLTQFLPISYVLISCGGRAGVCCPVPASPGTVRLCSARTLASKATRSRKPTFNVSVACMYSRAASVASFVPNAAALKDLAASATVLLRLSKLRGTRFAMPLKFELSEFTASEATRISFCRRLSSCAPLTAISISAL